jgi:peroxiredoxin
MKRPYACALLLLAACPAFAPAIAPAFAKGVKTSGSNFKSLSLVGKPAPGFTLQDFEGRSFDLSSTSGHIVLLSFWASWCGPCRAELPTLARLQKELGTELVDVVLVAMDNPVKAERVLKKMRLEARSLVDENGTLTKVYGVRAIPRAFVIGRDGMVRHVVFGSATEKVLRDTIQAARE